MMLLLNRGKFVAKIKRFNIKYHSKVKKLLSHISGDETTEFNELFHSFLNMLPTDLLPLRFRCFSESFMAINENKEVKALLTISPTKGNFQKWFLTRLFLGENSYDEGKQLIDYVVSKYGAWGADTFCVLIDENDENSAALFSKMCGFRLCSREVLWQLKEPINLDSSIRKNDFILFKNSDAKEVADLYNDAVYPHFRYSLECDKEEFYDFPFKGLCRDLSYKFVLKDNNGIFAYSELLSYDNKNWVIDIILSKQYEDSYFEVLKTLMLMLRNRSRNINIYVKNRNYMTSSKLYENTLSSNGFSKYQIKMLLVKDFFKPVKTGEAIVNPAIILNELPSNPAFTKFNTIQK